MRVRDTARVVVIDASHRILLLQFEDVLPLEPSRPEQVMYWVTPGGGREPGETYEQTALRELYEETGIRATGLGPWLWSGDRALIFPDATIVFRERYYLVRLAPVPCGDGPRGVVHELSTDAMLPYERQAYRSHRWWSLEEMHASTDMFVPADLPGLLAPVFRGELPARSRLIG